MIPSVLDVRGVPLPGLRPALAGHRAGRLAFGDLLREAARNAPEQVRRPALLPAFQPLRAPAAPAALHPAPATSSTAKAVPARVAPGRRRGSSGPGAEARQLLAAEIRRSAATAGVEPALSVAVARAESSLNPAARSPDGRSVGTFQVTATTAGEMRRRIAAGRVPRPAGNEDVALGIGYLRYLDDLFARRAVLARGLDTVPVADGGERRRFAVAAFNAGEGRVARAQAQAAAAGGDPTRFDDVRPYLPSITRTYVDRVLAYRADEHAARA